MALQWYSFNFSYPYWQSSFTGYLSVVPTETANAYLITNMYLNTDFDNNVLIEAGTVFYETDISSTPPTNINTFVSDNILFINGAIVHFSDNGTSIWDIYGNNVSFLNNGVHNVEGQHYTDNESLTLTPLYDPRPYSLGTYTIPSDFTLSNLYDGFQNGSLRFATKDGNTVVLKDDDEILPESDKIIWVINTYQTGIATVGTANYVASLPGKPNTLKLVDLFPYYLTNWYSFRLSFFDNAQFLEGYLAVVPTQTTNQFEIKQMIVSGKTTDFLSFNLSENLLAKPNTFLNNTSLYNDNIVTITGNSIAFSAGGTSFANYLILADNIGYLGFIKDHAIANLNSDNFTVALITDFSTINTTILKNSATSSATDAQTALTAATNATTAAATQSAATQAAYYAAAAQFASNAIPSASSTDYTTAQTAATQASLNAASAQTATTAVEAANAKLNEAITAKNNAETALTTATNATTSSAAQTAATSASGYATAARNAANAIPDTLTTFKASAQAAATQAEGYATDAQNVTNAKAKLEEVVAAKDNALTAKNTATDASTTLENAKTAAASARTYAQAAQTATDLISAENFPSIKSSAQQAADTAATYAADAYYSVINKAVNSAISEKLLAADSTTSLDDAQAAAARADLRATDAYDANQLIPATYSGKSQATIWSNTAASRAAQAWVEVARKAKDLALTAKNTATSAQTSAAAAQAAATAASTNASAARAAADAINVTQNSAKTVAANHATQAVNYATDAQNVTNAKAKLEEVVAAKNNAETAKNAATDASTTLANAKTAAASARTYATAAQTATDLISAANFSSIKSSAQQAADTAATYAADAYLSVIIKAYDSATSELLLAADLLTSLADAQAAAARADLRATDAYNANQLIPATYFDKIIATSISNDVAQLAAYTWFEVARKATQSAETAKNTATSAQTSAAAQAAATAASNYATAARAAADAIDAAQSDAKSLAEAAATGAEDFAADALVAVGNICFPAGTPVETDQGIVAIDLLDPKLHTIDSKAIVLITRTQSLDKYLVCFEQHALGYNVPSEKTLVSKFHLVGTEMKEAYKYLEPRNKLITKVAYNKEILYNVLLKKHGTMRINNMVCETLHPKNLIARLFKTLSLFENCEQKEEIKQYIIGNHNKKYADARRKIA